MTLSVEDRLIAGIFVAAMVVTGLVGYMASAKDGVAAIEPPPPSRWDAQMIALDEAALDAAYRQHVANMFLGWMKDSTGQPTRALNGVNQARRAYISAMDEIERHRLVPLPPARP
ncbi:MAG: hypothetical protein E6J90_08910 [Deltaproteobacteria bacterium]|nr:MAG: hypothetical protein E6J90_08910 [Deltaproteobacteria bacterium]